MDRSIGMVRVPDELRAKWIRMNPATVGSYVMQYGRILRVLGFPGCVLAVDIWSGEERLVTSDYDPYLPEYVTAHELIAIHENIKANG